MRSIESSAKTMEEAVTQGLEKLGVSLGDVSIDIIDEGSKGLFGLIGGKPARVRLTVKDSAEEADLLASLSLKAEPETASEAKPKTREKGETQRQERQPRAEKSAQGDTPTRQAPSAAPKAEKPTRAEAPASVTQAPEGQPPLCDPDTAAGKAQRFLMEVTRLMGVNVSVAASTDDENNIRVDMHGDTLGILIGRRGETLDALQYLTSLNVNRGQEDYTRVTIDTENYRSKREEALTRLANRMANRAIKTGRKVVLEPMNPYERRILHSALQQNAAVTTHSEGDEPNRHVVITLK